jgi:hypothetical protein
VRNRQKYSKKAPTRHKGYLEEFEFVCVKEEDAEDVG